MSNKNTTLQASKNLKDDEFYTTYECIEKELSHYTEQFYGKVVLCNCDDPYESNFCLYFLKNFVLLRLKRLICTSYYSSKIVSKKFDKRRKSNAYVLDINETVIRKELNDDEILNILYKADVIKSLEGNGDFRSEECLEYLDQADIVVTNPPFSLFRTFFSEIIKRNKLFFDLEVLEQKMEKEKEMERYNHFQEQPKSITLQSLQNPRSRSPYYNI